MSAIRRTAEDDLLYDRRQRFELSSSLLPGIVAHAAWNAIAMWQELAGGAAGLPLLLFGVLASAALVVRHGERLVSS